MMPPIAAVVATEEPEIAAKNAHATRETSEMPPEIQPTSESANETSRFERPPFAMISPARKNAGSASMEKLSQPVKIFCVIIASDRFGSSRMALMTAPPSAHVIGMPITMRTPSTTSRAMAEIIMMPFLPLSHELGVGVVHRSSAPSSETESTALSARSPVTQYRT